jgi:hypothetical protein
MLGSKKRHEAESAVFRGARIVFFIGAAVLPDTSLFI